MFGDDPLEEWLVYREMKREGEGDDVWEYSTNRFREGLDRLGSLLDETASKKVDYHTTGISPYWSGLIVLSPADLATARNLYWSVAKTGGTGSTYAQEGLLKAIATTAHPSSIPFWLEVLDFSRPRDSFAKTRRNLALAAIAFLAITQNNAAAYEALLSLTRHTNPDIRGLAVHYLGRAYHAAERTLSPEVQARLTEIATQDKAFLPRFTARRVLADNELPVPMDNPGGVYAFKVKFMWNKRIYRTIEVRSDQTLEDLHLAIQRAIRWDNDHLYSFFMNGQKFDENYRFVSPWEEEGPRFTTEAVIGELGLTLKHRFLYYFDYGDSHEFEVEVVDICPHAGPGRYPRVVDSKGKAPAQYAYWDEDGEEYEEYEEDYDEDGDGVTR